MNDRRWWHRWDEVGIAVGAFLVLINLFAVLTPYLSGPLFHPLWILVGIMLVFVCGMLLAGGDRDQAAFDPFEPR